MYYNCPHCFSKKKPVVIFPRTVKCTECGYVNTEKYFIVDGDYDISKEKLEKLRQKELEENKIKKLGKP